MKIATAPRSTRSLSIASAAIALLLLGACGGSTAGTTRPTSTLAATTSTKPSASVAATAAVVTAATTPAPSAASATTAPAQSAAVAASAPATASAEPSSAPVTAPVTSSAPVTSAAPAATPVPAPAATPAPAVQANTGPVAVTLIDVGVKLDRTSAGSGPVTFAIKNSGTVIHELILLKTDIPQDQIPVDPTKPGMVSQPGFLGQTGTLAAGATTNLSLTLPSGKYVLLCNQPAHYLIGMHTAFTVN